MPPLETTLAPALTDDVLELDELWSFVQQRKNKRWVWLAQCRRTRQIVAYALGGRGQKTCRLLWRRIPKTCRLLWRRIPKAYKKSVLYTDFWRAYAKVLPAAQHQATGTSIKRRAKVRVRPVTPIKPHIERFNNILRQRLARFVRKTLRMKRENASSGFVGMCHELNCSLGRRPPDGAPGATK